MKLNFNLRKPLSNSLIFTVLFLIFIALVLRYQFQVIHLLEWGDESETILVTKMMASGKRLYNEIFNMHGPLIFIPGLIISKLGDFEIWVYRLPTLILQWIAIASIAFSPIFSRFSNKLLGLIILISAIIVFTPSILGHQYLYQAYSGYIALIILYNLTFPSLLNVNRNKILNFLSGILVSSLFFLAITNFPMVIILLWISITKTNYKHVIFGFIVGIILNLLFLMKYGSIDGYFAYHIYLNAVILNEGKGILEYLMQIFNFYILDFNNILTLIVLLGLNLKMNKLGEKKFRNLLLIPMMMSLVLRDEHVFSFGGMTYIIIFIGMGMLFIIDESENTSSFSISKSLPLIIASLICIVLLVFPKITLNRFWGIPNDSDFSRITKRITSVDEKILAFSFRSHEYLLSDRMPASAHFIYLPIQAMYNQKPYKNIYVNVAEDMKKEKPKIILIDGWSLIQEPGFDWYTYADDVMKIVYTDYYKLDDKPIYIRRDIRLDEFGLDPLTGEELD